MQTCGAALRKHPLNGYKTTMSGRHDRQNGEPKRTDHEKPEASYHECVDQRTRETILKRDQYRCQFCARRGPEAGGLAELHVHHMERNPDNIDEHDTDNLTTICRICHIWQHQKRSPDEAPVTLTEEDLRALVAHDIDILRYLAAEGPARTGAVKDALPIDLSVMAVRERLWALMGLDNRIEARDQQIVDQDVETGEWGLVEQIETSKRGHIPIDPQQLVQRIEDEQVRQALDRGCPRDTVSEVFGIARRTSFYKEKRAYAYDFPLDAFRRGSHGTNRAAIAATQTPTGATHEQAEHQQQHLDTLADTTHHETAAANTTGNSSADHNADPEHEAGEEQGPTGEHAATDAHNEDDPIQRAIHALQAIENQS